MLVRETFQNVLVSVSGDDCHKKLHDELVELMVILYALDDGTEDLADDPIGPGHGVLDKVENSSKMWTKKSDSPGVVGTEVQGTQSIDDQVYGKWDGRELDEFESDLRNAKAKLVPGLTLFVKSLPFGRHIQQGLPISQSYFVVQDVKCRTADTEQYSRELQAALQLIVLVVDLVDVFFAQSHVIATNMTDVETAGVREVAFVELVGIEMVEDIDPGAQRCLLVDRTRILVLLMQRCGVRVRRFATGLTELHPEGCRIVDVMLR